MNIREVLEKLNNGTKAAALAKELNLADKRFREGMKKLGFEYSNSTKAWDGDEESEQYLDKSIFDYVPPKGNRGVKPKSRTGNSKVAGTQQVDSQEGNVSSHNSNMKGEKEFTLEQVSALQEIANQYLHDKENATQRDKLHRRIITLPEGKSIRKTVVIAEEVGERLDKFAKTMRFNKSDILSLALSDFLDRYEDEEK
ncbi:hypothetical protein COE14_28025 [Bacillus thuringiensis]|uniref:hypothetical protein n=1 Tax=Bacillus thuringiensis TaxID=1428 RepID=UPI000BFB6962|nr:hypothetical protein [Bacillus thuringiensis]PGW47226.1 hypothetical protein COE14_28025 [Bacillus thuringiensis]